MKIWDTILAVSPSAILAWFGVWLTPLEGTGVAHPKWESSANNLTVVFASVAVLVLLVISQHLSKMWNLVVFFLMLICLTVAGAYLYHVASETAGATEQDLILALQADWKIAYVVTFVFLLITIFFGFKLLIDQQRSG